MRHVIIVVIIVTFLNACKKSNSDSAPFTIPAMPAVATAVGAPMGTPVTKSIGPGGGTVLSADGRVELNFPASAVTANTNITIQPVSNTAPNGRGLSYHLMPDGSKFNVPVTLTFHYTAADADGTLPFLFYIATQDSNRVWQADFKNRAVDTVAKTASLAISHFSKWSLGSWASLFPSPPGVSASQTSDLFVTIVDDKGDMTPNAAGEFNMSPMPAVLPVPISNISNWTVNGKPGGSAQDGTISATDEKATFTAPATIDKERTVQAAASMNFGFTGWNKGKQVLKTTKVIMFTGIVLLPAKLSYTVNVKFTYNKSSVLINDVYTDGASFQVDIQGSSSSNFSHFVNQAPSVKPASGSYALTQCDWIYDDVGLVNVSGGLAIVSPANNSIILSIAHTKTVTPKWKYTDISNGSSYTIGGDLDIGYPSGLTFNAMDMPQHGTESNGFMVIDWDVTPVH